MVEELATELQDVSRSCRVLQVSTSEYYSWLSRPMSVRGAEDERVWQKIQKHWGASRKTYGRHRITKKLKDEGEKIGKNRVAKIMKAHDIRGKGKKKFKLMTTNSNHALSVADRVFKTENAKALVTAMNQFWGGDITYVPTDESWLYLAIVLDLFTKKAVGHAMRDRMRTELISEALELAIQRQGIARGSDLVFHSDRGSQYASEEYQVKLRAIKIKPSMSRKGNCYDNAIVESFFRTLKVELIYDRKFKTREEARAAIFEFIEVWYNRQ